VQEDLDAPVEYGSEKNQRHRGEIWRDLSVDAAVQRCTEHRFLAVRALCVSTEARYIDPS